MKKLEDYTKEELLQIIKVTAACSFETIDEVRKMYASTFGDVDPKKLPPEAKGTILAINFLIMASAPLFEIGKVIFPKSAEFIEELGEIRVAITDSIHDKFKAGKWEIQ